MLITVRANISVGLVVKFNYLDGIVPIRAKEDIIILEF